MWRLSLHLSARHGTWHESSEPRRYGELRGVPIHYWTRLLEDTQLERRVLRLEGCGAGCIVGWSVLRPGVLNDEVANQGVEEGVCVKEWCFVGRVKDCQDALLEEE